MDRAGSADCEQTAGPPPAGAVAKMLCDCLLERVLLAPNGAVLNLGRTMRTATAAQKRALAARDRGCVWPGCTIPARWTEAHHVPGWVHGSATDVDDMCLLFAGHPGMVDLGAYQVVMLDGVPHVVPPFAVDSERKPVRNTWWLDKRAARDVGNQLRLDLAHPPDDAGPPTC